MKSLAALAALILGTSVAFADEPVAQAEAGLLAPAAYVVVPVGMAAKVEKLNKVAALAIENCGRHMGERNPRPPDQRCMGWFARLEKAGEPGVHAMGRRLLAAGERDWRAGIVMQDFVRLMGDSGRAAAVPYLVGRLAQIEVDGEVRFWGEVGTLTAALSSLTGNAFGVRGPWVQEAEDDEVRLREWRRVAALWTAWFDDHRGEPREAWLAASSEGRRAALKAADLGERYHAVATLLGVPDEKEGATVALKATLSEPELPAEVSAAFRELARAQAVELGEAAAAAAAN